MKKDKIVFIIELLFIWLLLQFNTRIVPTMLNSKTLYVIFSIVLIIIILAYLRHNKKNIYNSKIYYYILLFFVLTTIFISFIEIRKINYIKNMDENSINILSEESTKNCKNVAEIVKLFEASIANNTVLIGNTWIDNENYKPHTCYKVIALAHDTGYKTIDYFIKEYQKSSSSVSNDISNLRELTKQNTSYFEEALTLANDYKVTILFNLVINIIIYIGFIIKFINDNKK